MSYTIYRCIHCGETTRVTDPWSQIRQGKIFLTTLELWKREWRNIFPGADEDLWVRVIHCPTCVHAEDEILGHFYSKYVFMLLSAFVLLVNGLLILYNLTPDGSLAALILRVSFWCLWIPGFIIVVLIQRRGMRSTLQNEAVLRLSKFNRVIGRRTKFFVILFDLSAFVPLLSILLFFPLSAIYFSGGLKGVPRWYSPNLCTFPVLPWCPLCGVTINPRLFSAFSLSIADYKHNNQCSLLKEEDQDSTELSRTPTDLSNLEQEFLKKLHRQDLKKEQKRFFITGMLMLLLYAIAFYIFLESWEAFFVIVFPAVLFMTVVAGFFILNLTIQYRRLRNPVYWRKQLK
jgi:hypothetical protein